MLNISTEIATKQFERDCLLNKTIVVTGATDGIGRIAALHYAQAGANLILLGRNLKKLIAVQKEIMTETGHKPDYVQLDLDEKDPHAYELAAQNIANNTDHLDGCLHSAGILGEISPISSHNPRLWCDVMQVNVHAPFLLTQALLPLLLRSKSASLVLTTSSVGQKGRKHWGAYSVSKFATEGFIQVLADEYKGTVLRVNGINPGATRTKMRALAMPNENPDTVISAAAIMPTYLYLMSDASIGINGQVLLAQPQRLPTA